MTSFTFPTDVTAVCILESFENQQSLLMADRVLKELGKTKAKEAYKVRISHIVYTNSTNKLLHGQP